MRSDLYKNIHESYHSCKDAARSHFYYLAVAKCIEDGKGEEINGGCYHVVSYQENFKETDSAHCKVLKPTIEDFEIYLSEQREEKGVEKCLK